MSANVRLSEISEPPATRRESPRHSHVPPVIPAKAGTQKVDCLKHEHRHQSPPARPGAGTQNAPVGFIVFPAKAGTQKVDCVSHEHRHPSPVTRHPQLDLGPRKPRHSREGGNPEGRLREATNTITRHPQLDRGRLDRGANLAAQIRTARRPCSRAPQVHLQMQLGL